MLFLIETKGDKRAMESLKFSLGFAYCFIIYRAGLSACLAFFGWMQWMFRSYLSLVAILIVRLNTETKFGALHFFIYGYPEVENKHMGWDLLDLRSRSNFPWIIFRDFNEIINDIEKVVGNSRSPGLSDLIVMS